MNDQPYVIFFDGQCELCRRGRRNIERLRPRAEVRFVDVHDKAELSHYPALTGADVLGQMYVLSPTGELSGGYDALLALAPILPTFRWLRGVLASRPVRAVGRWAYRWVAANRYRLSGQATCREGACGIRPARRHG